MASRFARIILLISAVGLTGCGVFSPSPTRTSTWKSDVPVGGFVHAPLGMSVSQAVSEMTSRSVLLLGTPYKLGGTHPSEGFDCSGLIAHVVQDAFRVKFPRTVEEQAEIGQEIPRQSLSPGDLVFFNTQGRKNSHVGLYLGDSRFIHAPNQRGVVRIESMRQGYWSERFDQARRMIARND